MDLKTAIARLNRAGHENPVYQRKLTEAATAMGGCLHDIFPERSAVKLPRGYSFKHASRTWSLLKEDPDSGKALIYFTGGFSQNVELSFDLSHLLEFAKDINQGWLDEVSQFLESENSPLSSATMTIRARIFMSAREGYVPGSGTLSQDLRWLIGRASEAGQRNYEGWKDAVPHLNAALTAVHDGADFPG